MLKKIIYLFIFIALAGCGKSDGPTDNNSKGFIKGKITIQPTGVPINAASVSTNPPTVTALTDGAGNYKLDNVPTGSYTVLASKSGYSANSTTAAVTEGDTATANIQLTLGGSLPAPPSLVFPLSNSINKTLSNLFVWEASPGATSYKLEVSSNSSFTYIIEEQVGITSTSKNISGFNPNSQYWWRVSSVNVHGTSEPSLSWSFRTGDGQQGLPCFGLPTVVYAGKTYNTIQIGNQCWMKENLDVGIMITGYVDAENNGIIEKFCMNDDSLNCMQYGALYQWHEAMGYSLTPSVRGICPPGWHIPTKTEIQLLTYEAGNDGNALKAVGVGFDNGTGTNTTGFTSLLGGDRNGSRRFSILNVNGFYWTSNMMDVQYISYYFSLSQSSSNIDIYDHANSYAMSIRCLKD